VNLYRAETLRTTVKTDSMPTRHSSTRSLSPPLRQRFQASCLENRNPLVGDWWNLGVCGAHGGAATRDGLPRLGLIEKTVRSLKEESS
jgi:hypothetical protein